MIIKVLGEYVAITTGGETVDNSVLVRLHAIANTDVVVSDPVANTVIGSFVISGGYSEIVEKKSTDLIIAGADDVLTGTPIAYKF